MASTTIAQRTVRTGSLTSRGRPATEWEGYLFVAFFAVPFLVFNICPILFGAVVGFTEWGIIGTPEWVGLDNFRAAFADEWVAVAFRNVLLYALIIVPGVTVLGLAFALFVNQRWPLSALARTVFFSPYVVSATVIGLIWVWILDTRFGIINQYLGAFGIEPIPWLTSTEWSLIGVSIASIWWDLGLAFVLFLAGLQDVPQELYEAAEVDGASRWQRFWHVTLPYIRDHADLQSGVRDDQRRTERLVVLGNLLHVHDRRRPDRDGLRLRDRDASVRSDPGAHAHAALHPSGAGPWLISRGP
jgi:ABC-type sugar transport system permease subunit